MYPNYTFRLSCHVLLTCQSLSCKLALMGAHEEDSVLLQTLTRRVVLHQVSTAAVVSLVLK